MIPKIIHITYKNQESLHTSFIKFDDGTRQTLYECVRTFRNLNPHWKVIFHSDKDINEMISEKYPAFFPFYEKLKIIERVDIFRYVCLLENGGLFLDTDCLCIRPLDEFLSIFPESKIIVGQEFLHKSNWFNYPPHFQINLWSIFAEKGNHHLRNIIATAIGNCMMSPEMPVIEKTSMAVFGDYLYKAAKIDPTVSIVSSSYLSMDGRLKYMHSSSYGFDGLPAYILHGYHSSWIDDDFRKYAKEMEIRDSQL